MIHSVAGTARNARFDRSIPPTLSGTAPHRLGRGARRRKQPAATGRGESGPPWRALFLDELPEFRRSALESLRQPIEDGRAVVVRSGRSAVFPVSLPTGRLDESRVACGLTRSNAEKPLPRVRSTEIRRYRTRVSGPLLDRIDLHVWVPPVDVDRLTGEAVEETSAAVRTRVEAARFLQAARAEGGEVQWNATLEGKKLRRACRLPTGGRALLSRALRRRGFSGRAIHRVLRVARTIADLDGVTDMRLADLAEAVRYRILSDGASGDAAMSSRTAAR